MNSLNLQDNILKATFVLNYLEHGYVPNTLMSSAGIAAYKVHEFWIYSLQSSWENKMPHSPKYLSLLVFGETWKDGIF